MLVLTRRTGQMIMIYDPKTDTTIEVTVTEIHGDNVRLGVTAPHNIAVDRSEIAAEKKIAPRTLTI